MYDDTVGSFRQYSLYIKCIKKENFRGLLRSFRTTYTQNHFSVEDLSRIVRYDFIFGNGHPVGNLL